MSDKDYTRGQLSTSIEDNLHSYGLHGSFTEFPFNQEIQDSHSTFGDHGDEEGLEHFKSERNGNGHNDENTNEEVYPSGDPEEPMTHEEYSNGFQRLLSAMKNVIDTDDPADSQTVKRFRKNQFYPEEAYERLAANVLSRIDRAQQGALSLTYHKRSYKAYASREERIKKFLELIRKSKSALKMLLDADYLDRCLDDPEKELQSKRANRVLNEIRNKQVIAGKAALKEEARLHGTSDDNDLDQKPKQNVATPRKPTTPILQTPKTVKKETVMPESQITTRKPPSSKRKLEDIPVQPRKRIYHSQFIKQDADYQTLPPIPAQLPTHTHQSHELTLPPALTVEPRDMLDATLEVYYQDVALTDIEAYVELHGRQGLNGPLFELCRRYRVIISTLLGIRPGNLTVAMLRTYARAHYSPMQNQTWYHPSLATQFGGGVRNMVWDIYQSGTFVHISTALPDFVGIARERGDIDQHGNWDRNVIQYIAEPLVPEQQRAMGLVPNALNNEGLAYLGRPDQSARDVRR